MKSSTMTAAQAQCDPEIQAKYALHEAKRTKANKKPWPFDLWFECYESGRRGGTTAGKAKAVAKELTEA